MMLWQERIERFHVPANCFFSMVLIFGDSLAYDLVGWPKVIWLFNLLIFRRRKGSAHKRRSPAKTSSDASLVVLSAVAVGCWRGPWWNWTWRYGSNTPWECWPSRWTAWSISLYQAARGNTLESRTCFQNQSWALHQRKEGMQLRIFQWRFWLRTIQGGIFWRWWKLLVPHQKNPPATKVFVRKGEVPPLTQVSVADFKDGGYFEAHDHEDMFESLGF